MVLLLCNYIAVAYNVNIHILSQIKNHIIYFNKRKRTRTIFKKKKTPSLESIVPVDNVLRAP